MTETPRPTRHIALAAAAASVLALAACGGRDEARSDSAGEPTAASTPATGAANEAAMPPATTVQGFLARTALGDMFEVQSSQAVLERTQNAEVRRFAQMMVQDHTRTSNEAQAAARAQEINLAPPLQLDERRADMVRRLRDAAAGDLDQRYVEQQVEAHENALNLMRDFAQNGDNAALQDWARRTAPVIENHLQMARALQAAGAADRPASGGGQP